MTLLRQRDVREKEALFQHPVSVDVSNVLRVINDR